MKPTGCKLSYGEQRDAELYEAYKRLLSSYTKENGKIDNMGAVSAAVKQPCSRFWISEDVAVHNIRAIIANPEVLERMIATKRAMYEDLMEVYWRLRNDPENCNLDDKQIAYMASDSPAREFYMTPGSAIIKICAERKKRMSRKTDLSQKILSKAQKQASRQAALQEARKEHNTEAKPRACRTKNAGILRKFSEFRPRPLNWKIRKKARTALQYVIRWSE